MPEFVITGVRPLGAVVKDSVPCSTSRVMLLRLLSASATESSLVPAKSIAVLTAVVTEVVLVELMGVPLK